MKTIDDIKHTSIKGYLARQGIHPIKEYSGYGIYKSPFRNEQMPSFKVDYKVNLWYDFGSGEGGSVIDLVMKMKKCSLAQAITLLEEKADFPFRVKTAFPSPAESVERMKLLRTSQFLPLHLANYVRERGISADVAAKFLTAVYYRVNGKEYSALGFKNDAGGYELRNPYFKGCYPPKEITTFDRRTASVYLFEGFMDYLSLLTMQAKQADVSALVLNSVANIDKALPFLSKHTRINAFLDNDVGGKRTLEKLQNLQLPIVDYSIKYAKCKDLNDHLIRKKLSETVNHTTNIITSNKPKRLKF